MNKPSRAQLGQFGPYSTPTIPYLYHNPTLPYPTPTLPYPTPFHHTPAHHTTPNFTTPHHTSPHYTTPHYTTPHHTIPYPTLPLPYLTLTSSYPYHTHPYPTLPLAYPTPTIPYPYHTLPYPTRPFSYHILPLPYFTLYTWQAFLLKRKFYYCFRLNQIGEKIRFGKFTFTVSTTVFSLEPRCSHKIKTKIIIPSIQNQNSLLVKWETDSIVPGGGGIVDREVRRLVPSSHKRSDRRHKIILLPDSGREKAI